MDAASIDLISRHLDPTGSDQVTYSEVVQFLSSQFVVRDETEGEVPLLEKWYGTVAKRRNSCSSPSNLTRS